MKKALENIRYVAGISVSIIDARYEIYLVVIDRMDKTFNILESSCKVLDDLNKINLNIELRDIKTYLRQRYENIRILIEDNVF